MTYTVKITNLLDRFFKNIAHKTVASLYLKKKIKTGLVASFFILPSFFRGDEKRGKHNQFVVIILEILK